MLELRLEAVVLFVGRFWGAELWRKWPTEGEALPEKGEQERQYQWKKGLEEGQYQCQRQKGRRPRSGGNPDG